MDADELVDKTPPPRMRVAILVTAPLTAVLMSIVLGTGGLNAAVAAQPSAIADLSNGAAPAFGDAIPNERWESRL